MYVMVANLTLLGQGWCIHSRNCMIHQNTVALGTDITDTSVIVSLNANNGYNCLISGAIYFLSLISPTALKLRRTCSSRLHGYLTPDGMSSGTHNPIKLPSQRHKVAI